MFRTLNLDRVLEVAAAPGTGAVTLGGAVTGYRSFASIGQAIFGNADTCAYFIEAVDGGGIPTGLWERGFGTGTGNPITTFTRTTIVDGSSGPGVAVNFATAVRIGVSPMTDTTMIYPTPGGRLSGVDASTPVGDTPGGGSTGIFYVPYLHDKIALWNGAGIQVIQFVGAAVPGVSALAAGKAYDIFGYIVPGTATALPTLALETLVWTTAIQPSPARATALVYSNGFLCKSGDPTRRYLGSIYTPTLGAIFDYANPAVNSAGGKRFLWNMYNRLPRSCYVYDSTSSWTENNTAWHIIRGQAAPTNCIEMFRGLNEDAVVATYTLSGACPQSGGFYGGIGVNSAAPGSASAGGSFYNSLAGTQTGCVTSGYTGMPGLGYCTLSMNELNNGAVVNTFGATYSSPTLTALLMS